MNYEAAVIGVSSGGLRALKTLLQPLPANFSIPLVLVQHIGASSDGFWIEMLNNTCSLKVKEAEEKEEILKGHVYVAPANYHLLIEANRTFALSADSRVNFARPSIDVLFESAARAYANNLIGIILTGSNHDGANGMKTIKEAGGLVIAEDPATATSPFMPEAAIRATQIDHVLPLEKIVNLLLKLEKI
jgi:two-component system, chemotaxis family, protein-glutamate methylesterase/glutaminase